MSSVRQKLLEMNRKNLNVYMSSILIKNHNIPKFEEYFGQLDYDWLLRLSENRKWKTLKKPLVIRYVDGNNLSLNNEYRTRDFYMAMIYLNENLSVMKKLCGSRARYYYLIGNPKMARFYFKQSEFNLKTILYFLTSYLPSLRKFIIKKFRVFG